MLYYQQLPKQAFFLKFGLRRAKTQKLTEIDRYITAPLYWYQEVKIEKKRRNRYFKVCFYQWNKKNFK